MQRVRPVRMSATETAAVWVRWRRGGSISEIGRAMDRSPGSIFYQLATHGGISPVPRTRSGVRSRCMTVIAQRFLAAMASGRSLRAISAGLGRAPSTISREVSAMAVGRSIRRRGRVCPKPNVGGPRPRGRQTDHRSSRGVRTILTSARDDLREVRAKSWRASPISAAAGGCARRGRPRRPDKRAGASLMRCPSASVRRRRRTDAVPGSASGALPTCRFVQSCSAVLLGLAWDRGGELAPRGRLIVVSASKNTNGRWTSRPRKRSMPSPSASIDWATSRLLIHWPRLLHRQVESTESFFHCRRPACCTCRIVRSRAGDRGRRPDTVAVLVGGMTTVAPRAPAAS